MDKSDNDDVTDNDDEKDEDFDIKDYRDDIDSDESFEDYEDNDNENTLADGDESEYTGAILPGGHRFDKKLFCIKYPGVVENSEKALETLGGIASISTTVKTKNRRLELHFRPNDGYSKPTCGDRHQTAGFLLRIRVKKSRAQQLREQAAKNAENLDSKGPFELSKLNELGSLGKKIYSSDSDAEQKNLMTNLDELLGPLGKKVYSSDSDTEQTKAMQNLDVEKLADSVKDNCTVKDSPENEKNSPDTKIKNIPPISEREIKRPAKDSPKISKINERNIWEKDEENGKGGEDLSQNENYEVPKLKVVGRVDTEFRFQNLCDFQYLPITKGLSDPNVDECIYESVYPAEIPSYRWLKNKVPYFLPPAAFSRMDSVQQYSLKRESDKGPENIIGKTRKRRAGFSNFIHFSSPETPSIPPPGIETARKMKFLQESHLERMKLIFDERPIWSKSALVCISKFTGEQLKFLLPSVAYYFMTGPWRVMWVKLGYDPRKDPHARKYQTLDYRMKAMHGLESTIKCKRTPSEYSLPYKSVQGMRPRTTILSSMAEGSESQKIETRTNDYIYREGMVPPSRQMFYQYCDVEVPEIQEMLAKLPNILPGAKCHEKRGWLPAGFGDQCREIINRQVRAVLRKQMNIPVDQPTRLPPKRRIRKNLRLSKLTTEELKMRHQKKKRKEPEGSDSDWTTIDNTQKKIKPYSTT